MYWPPSSCDTIFMHPNGYTMISRTVILSSEFCVVCSSGQNLLTNLHYGHRMSHASALVSLLQLNQTSAQLRNQIKHRSLYLRCYPLQNTEAYLRTKQSANYSSLIRGQGNSAWKPGINLCLINCLNNIETFSRKKIMTWIENEIAKILS